MIEVAQVPSRHFWATHYTYLGLLELPRLSRPCLIISPHTKAHEASLSILDALLSMMLSTQLVGRDRFFALLAPAVDIAAVLLSVATPAQRAFQPPRETYIFAIHIFPVALLSLYDEMPISALTRAGLISVLLPLGHTISRRVG